MSLINLSNRMRPINLTTLSKCFSIHFNKPSDANDSSSNPKKLKTVPIPRITLVNGEEVLVSTLLEAQKLAKRRDLRLVRILDFDVKTRRPIYKLMTGSEYHAEDLKQREEKKKERLNSTVLKGEKLLIVKSGISEHDLKSHNNKIIKWLAKRYEVRVSINGNADNMEKAESVFASIEDLLKQNGNAKILQKRQKGNEIRFQIVPAEPPAADSSKGDKEPKES